MPNRRLRGARRPSLPTAAAAVALVLASCGGGGGGTDNEEPPAPPSDSITYGIGGPRSTLGQTALSIDLAPAGTALARAAPQARRAALASGEGFEYPAGPDGNGDTLPLISGSFNTLTETYDEALGSKLWIDLPASAGGYRVALQVSRVLQSAGSLAEDVSAGEIVVTPRQTYEGFTGRVRLAFGGTGGPVCLAWDAAADGSYEVEQCMTIAQLGELWATPRTDWALPAAVQRAAAASHGGWRRFYEQFDLSVGAMRMASAQHDSLAGSAPGAGAASIPCGVDPVSGHTGQIALSWLDRNGSGRFDTGDDVRLQASDCWNPTEDEAAAAGRRFDGVLELRAYERDVGAAPTFVGLRVADTGTVDGVASTLGTHQVDGGFSLRVPGIIASSDTVASYRFSSENMAAAGAVAARSMSFYPEIADLAFRALEAARVNAAGTRTGLALCSNAGRATLTWDEGPAPNSAGLSAGDTVRITVDECDLGPGGHPRVTSGQLLLSVWGVTAGTGTDWTVRSNVSIDLRTATARGSTHRVGETGLEIGYVLGHSFGAAFRPQSVSSAQSINGVLTSFENGVIDYQIGCYAADYYRGTWALSDYQLLPNQVVKTSGRVFTIGMRQGESFVFKADGSGSYAPDVALAALLPISAPECVALGVPASGVSGGPTNMQFDAWPAGDGGRIELRLYDSASNALLKTVVTDWSTLVR